MRRRSRQRRPARARGPPQRIASTSTAPAPSAHADADLSRLLRDRVTHHAEDAGRRQDQRHRGEQRQQRHVEARPRDRARHRCRCNGMASRERRGSDRARGSVRGPHGASASGSPFGAHDDADRAAGALRVRQEQLRGSPAVPGVRCSTSPTMPTISRGPPDAARACRSDPGRGTSVRTASFVEQRHRRRLRLVEIVEQPPALQRRADRLEIIRRARPRPRSPG